MATSFLSRCRARARHLVFRCVPQDRLLWNIAKKHGHDLSCGWACEIDIEHAGGAKASVDALGVVVLARLADDRARSRESTWCESL